MTPKQRAVIEASLRKPTRIVEIDRREGRLYRETAMINTLRKLRDQREDELNLERLRQFERNDE